MKRSLSLLLILLLVLGAAPLAHAADPKPIEIIPYDSLPEPREGQYHYLLLCVDNWYVRTEDFTDNPTGGSPRNGDLGDSNTDGIVLVTLDTRAHRVMLTSFIRDALVQRPDGVIGRINYVADGFGPEALCRTISSHIGVKVENYILFGFQQIENIINFMGGVDITITAAESSYLQRYAIPKDSTEPQLNGAGTYHFNGHAAVIYMRIRKVGGGGDFMRTQRVRTVLSTLADQCRDISEEEARRLVDSISANTTLTNMNLDAMVTAMERAYGLRTCTIEELRIPPDGAARSITYKGMAVQELDWAACRAAMSSYLETSFLVLDQSQESDLDSLGDLGDLDSLFGDEP